MNNLFCNKNNGKKPTNLPKYDVNYLNNMYPQTMLDDKNTYQNCNETLTQKAQIQGVENEQKRETNQASLQENLTSLLQNLQGGNNLSSLLPMLLQGNLQNSSIMGTMANLPPISGQNGANLINILSNLSNKKSPQDEDKIEKYKIIKDLD